MTLAEQIKKQRPFGARSACSTLGELLSTVAGERLYRVPYELEEYIALAKLTRRTVIVFTYANEHDLSDKTISHETMESIYAPEIGKN